MRTLRGCWWWTVTISVALFLVGLVLVYPWLLIVTAILLGLFAAAVVIASTKLRRSKP